MFGIDKEFPRYPFIWIVFLGAAYCSKSCRHIVIDGLVLALPARIRAYLQVAVDLLIIVLMGTLVYYGWTLTYEQAPMKVLALFQDAKLSKAALLLTINVIMLILGCFLEGLAVMVMAVPVLMPLLRQVGIDPIHFGVLFVLNIMIGTITPPQWELSCTSSAPWGRFRSGSSPARCGLSSWRSSYACSS